ncbi:hypothetical protein SLS55_002816 [Diplodia seriata]|uniref:Uncharacterized protein n=1 Tax=Diplodia seriata TaxID=420778 RepID=A0ABR3CL81_9PEZI
MLRQTIIRLLLGASIASAGYAVGGVSTQQDVMAAPHLSINGIPHSTRAHWMRRANAALADLGGSPCPFAAFGSAVVNHTDTADGGLGELCASAIRWAGFKEYIYGTSIDTLVQRGWGQIRIASLDVFRQSFDLPSQTRLIGGVLTNETDPYFWWQYDPESPCPPACSRAGHSCSADE